MDNLTQECKKLLLLIDEAVSKLDIQRLEQELAHLESQTLSPEFWSDQKNAQQVTQKISQLKNRISPWRAIQGSAQEALSLAELGDDSLQAELDAQLTALQQKYTELKTELLYGGEYDDHNAIVSIFAGAGGTDAQDWAEMLQRMYLRWAEQHAYSVDILEQSGGDEAGIKSVTFEVTGLFVFGRLKGEHGVHRLVRLSPFNADNLRQTSFAKVDVVPKIDSPEAVQIDEKDLKIDVYRAGGHGGQSVNTTDSAVRITHIPTGITVAIQNERSQLQNKETAMTILRSRLAQLQLEQHKETLAELKGPNEQAAWGNQIRNYVLHPYTMVKDTRTKHETSDAASVLDGNIDDFITTYLEHKVSLAS